MLLTVTQENNTKYEIYEIYETRPRNYTKIENRKAEKRKNTGTVKHRKDRKIARL